MCSSDLFPSHDICSRHFATTEKTAVNNAVTAIETALATKLANLTAEERQQYGSVNEQNKLIINKVKDFRDSQPALSSPDVDWTEFMSDYDTRAFIQATMQRLQSLIDGLNNAKILHDWDNYQAYRDWETDRKSTRLNSSHITRSRMPSSA